MPAGVRNPFAPKNAAMAASIAVALSIPLLCLASVRAARPHQSECVLLLRIGASDCSRTGLREPPAGASWLSPRAKSGANLVYADIPLGDAIEISSISDRGLKPAGQIALDPDSIPVGMTVDAKTKDLYVADSALLGPPGIPRVDVFPPGATKPSKSYSKGLSTPADVAVDGSGNVFVANLSLGSDCTQQSGDGNVVEYAKGSMAPTAVITDVPGCPYGVAVDAAGSLYVAYVYFPSSYTQYGSQSDVIEYAPGSTRGSPLHLIVPGLGAMFYGVAIDRNGDVVVANDRNGPTFGQILTYPHGARRPSSVIQYGGVAWQPNFFALRGNRIFGPSYAAQFQLSLTAEIGYPSGREVFVQSPKFLPPQPLYGFAVSP